VTYVESRERPPLLMLFVKYPELGRVKTRIAAEAGQEEAAVIYRQLVAAVLDGIPAGQRVRVLYDDFRAEWEYQNWLQHPALVEAEFCPQSTGDLGQRLRAAFAAAFRSGWQRVGVIGSDCMELSSAIYAQAWCALNTHDLVIGPTLDGGYYFLAMKTDEPSIFSDIEWSSERVFTQTEAAAQAAGLTWKCLEPLRDIDTLKDWQETFRK